MKIIQRSTVYLPDETAENSDYCRLLERLASDGVPKDARIVYEGRNRIYEWHGLSIKEFARPSWLNSYIYGRLRKTKAFRSLDNAQGLESLGIGTPKPIAAVEVYNNPRRRLLRSYYVCLHVEAEGDMRLWLDNPKAAAHVPQVAELLAKMHFEEIWHRDFSPGNILFAGNNLYLIDLNRIDWDVANPRKLMRNLGVIYIESAAETERFARLYAKAAGLDPDIIAQVALAEREKYLVKKGRRYKLKTKILGLVGRKPKRPPHPLWKI